MQRQLFDMKQCKPKGDKHIIPEKKKNQAEEKENKIFLFSYK